MITERKEDHKMARLIKTWKELDGLENENYIINVDLDKYNGWIYPKDKNKFPDEEYWKHNVYLSTHTFYENHYKESTRLLQKFGFDVEIDNWG